MLDTTDVQNVRNLIKDSFRVRENHDPVYVELGDNLVRFASAQQQVLFGRRGSGKSCLLVHLLRSSDRDRQTLAIYVGIDEIKRLGFPDVLIRILLTIFEKLPLSSRPWFKWWKSPLNRVVDELKSLLDEPDSADTSTRTAKDNRQGLKLGAKGGGNSAGLNSERSEASETTRTFVGRKLDHLERHLQDYKKVLASHVNRSEQCTYVLVDDFYLIQKEMQPDVVDYLHRLLRGTNAYLKLATIRHRTVLRRHDGQTVGVELQQDIEEISLDKTFEDFESTHQYLFSMLHKMSTQVAPEIVTSDLFNAEAGRALTLASGGVPRDFLNIFVDAIELSIRAGKYQRLTPTFIYKAATALSYKSKLTNLKEEAGYDSESLERLFTDLVKFCLGEKKKTVFLVKHDDAHTYPDVQELLAQLMDFKLIHLVASNTSAASGRAGRYTAYTLDFSIFMEPRRRGIEIVEFWNTDDQRRPIGVRESPDYSLARAGQAISVSNAGAHGVDEIVDSLEVEENPQELPTADSEGL